MKMIEKDIIDAAINDYILLKKSIDAISLDHNIGSNTLRRALINRNIPLEKYRSRFILDNHKKQQILELKKLNVSSSKICKTLGIKYGVLRNFLESEGLLKHRIYHIDDKFFKTIDEERKAIILGFLYADGYVDKRKYAFKIHLQKSDEDILIQIKNIINSDHPIKYRKIKNHLYSLVCFNNKVMVDDLVKLGCVNAKTYKIRFPIKFIPKEFLWAFIYGYWLGDGWSCCSNKNRINAKIGLMSNKWFIYHLKKFLLENGVTSCIYKHHISKDVSTLLIGHQKDILFIIDKFITFSKIIKIDRKVKKLLALQKRLHDI